MSSSIMVLVYNSNITQKFAKIHPEREYTLNFHVCNRINPSSCGVGITICRNKEEIWASSLCIGNRTNIESEYCALSIALQYAIDMNIKDITICGDNLLVMNQVNGKYKVKTANLSQHYNKIMNLKNSFNYTEFVHISKEANLRASQLAKLFIEEFDYNYEYSSNTETKEGM